MLNGVDGGYGGNVKSSSDLTGLRTQAYALFTGGRCDLSEAPIPVLRVVD